MRRGHTPVRTCVVCGMKAAKGELIRVVRTTVGRVEVDTTGKTPGRGAYLCQSESCWEKALKKNRLDRALKGPLSPEDRLALWQWAQTGAEAPLQR